MADIQANIGIGVDTSQALAAIRQLQREISVFHTLMAKGGASAAAKSMQMQQGLINTINETGKFSASMTRISSSTESFTNALEKNKLSMGQYFRYAGGASKTFGKVFSREFNTVNRVAQERVKDLQTQYISMGRDANGALQSIKVRPLALDMDNLGTKVQLAAQKQQIFNQLMKQGTTNLLNFGKNTQWAGRQLMVGFTIPLTIFGSLAAKEFQKLEEQAVKFRRVYGDMFTTDADTEKALANVRQLADEFTKYGIAVEKTIGLAAKVAQMGNVGPALEAQVTQATRLAVLGGMEQEEALDTTISLTNAFGIAAEDLAGKIAFLNAAENQTILSIEDFNEAIPKAGSVVQQLGGSVEDLAFFLTAMREGGINASQGANALKTSLARLVAPTEVAKKEMAAFGIDIVGIVEKNAGNLRNTVTALGQELDRLDPLNKARAIEQLFGKFQFARMSTMFQNISKDGSQANKILALTTATTEELAIVAERELKRVEESPAFKLQKQMEQLRAALAPIGEEFIKAVGPLIEFGTKLLKSFNNLGDGGKQFVVVLTAIAGVVAPAALMAFGLIANGVANLLKFFQFLGNAFGMLSGQSTMLGGQTEYMTQQQIEAAAVAASLGQSHSNLTQIFTAEAGAISNLVAQYNAAITAQRQLSIGQTAAGVAARGGSRIQGFARGGIVRGPGTGTSDSILSLISNGEAVIPAAVVRENPEIIKQLISGKIPGFSEGGTVGKIPFKSSSAGEKASDLRLALGQNADLLETALKGLVVELQDGTKVIQGSFDNIRRATTEEASKQGRWDTEGLSGTSTRRAHATLPLTGQARDSAIKEAGYDKLPPEMLENVKAVSNFTVDLPQAMNVQMDRGGVEAETFGQIWNSKEDKITATAAQGGYDTEDVEKRKTLLDFENKLGQEAIQVATERTAAGEKVVVTDNDLAAATERLIAQYRQMEGNKGELGEVLHERATTTGGVRSSQPKEYVESNMAGETGPGFVRTGSGGELGYRTEDGTVVPRVARDASVSRSSAGSGFKPPGGKTYQDQPIMAQDAGTFDEQQLVQEAKSVGEDTGQGVIDGYSERMQISSPSKRMYDLGANAADSLADGFQQGMADETGKPPLPGNLAAPKPPVQPASAQPGRFGKFFSSAKDKINESKVAQRAADYLSGADLDEKRPVGPGMSDAEREAHRTAKAINQDLYDKGLITEDMQATPLGQTQGVTPVRVVDGQLDIGDNSIDQLADASPAANDAAEQDKLTKATKDQRVAQEEATKATQSTVKTQEQKDKDDKAALKEQKRQGRQAVAGKALLGLGSITAGLGAATQLTGVEVAGINVGETAQKLLPVAGALTGILPMLLALGPVLGGLVAVVGLVAYGFYKYNQMLNEVTKNARELAENLGAGSKAMGMFAEVAGKATASEIMTERRKAGTLGTAVGKSDFGESFVAGDEGQKYIEDIKKGFEELGKDETVAKVRQQLATAVYSGIFTVEQANGIAVEVMRSLDELGIGIEVAGDLTALFGPNGENILTNPLKISFELIQTGSEEIETSIENLIQKTINPGKMTSIWDIFNDEEAAAKLAGDLVAFAGQRQEILDAERLAAENEAKRLREDAATARAAGDNVQAEELLSNANKVMADYETRRAESLQNAADAANIFVNQAESVQSTMQRIEDVDLPAFNAWGYDETSLQTIRMVLQTLEDITGVDFGEIEDMSEDQLSELYKQNREDIEGLDNIATSFNKTLDQMGNIVKERYEDNEILSGQIDALIDSETSSFRFKQAMLEGLSTGVLQPSDTEAFLTNFSADVKTISDEAAAEWRKNFKPTSPVEADYIAGLDDNAIKQRVAEDNKKIQDAYADIDLNLNQGASQTLLDTMGKISTEAGGAVALSVQADIDSGDLVSAEKALETFQDLASIDSEEINPTAVVEFYLANPGEFEKYQEAISEFESLVAESDDGKVTYEQVISRNIITDGVAMDVIKADQEYFDSLSPFQQSTYLRALLRVEDTFTADDFNAWKAKNPWVDYAGIDATVQYNMAVSAAVQDVAGFAGFKPPEEGDETPKTDNSGGAEPQIDSLIKKLRDLRDASIDMKKGWEGMQQVLDSIFAGGTKELNLFDGLEKQLRSLSLGEGLISQIVGMDPDEFEKRKNELFKFDGKRIVGATAALTNMNKAFNAVAIGEYVNGQEKSLQTAKDQITAMNTLQASGMSLADAYDVVQDSAMAAAIAQGASTEQLQEIIRITELAKQKEKELAKERERINIAESVRKTNEEFQKRVSIYEKLTREAQNYTDAQIDAILSDSNIGSIFLDPSIDSGALTQALADAERAANLELNIRKLTVEGSKGIFEEGFGQAMDAFGRQEQEIELNFKVANADDTALVEDAQNRIADIQYQLDDYNAELERISWQEEDINEKYEKRFEALESIADANERIANQQKAQLDIADALSRGDIAAAARAQEALRSQQAQDAAQTQREMLERAQESEIAALTSGGLNREQLEDRIRGLERQIFNIEETDLEPAQERLRLQEIIKQDQIESLTVLEKTRDEWDRIKSNIDIAEASGYKFKETMEEALSVVEKLMESYPTEKPLPPPPPPPPARSSGGGGGKDLGQPGKGAWEIGGVPLATLAANEGMHWTDYYNKYRGSQALDTKLTPAASGGLMKLAMGGKVGRYAGGGMIIPKRMANGGYSMGSDIIPAILTPGEFVVRRPAVSAFGVDKLEQINRGTYSDGAVYNYNLAVNVKSDSDPNRIARVVMSEIRGIESQRIRSNKL